MRILIVSDGKPGHFNQSLGVVAQLPEAEFDQFEVKFKSKFRDNLIRLIFTLFGGLRLPKYLLRSLFRFALTDSVCQKALEYENKGYEVVISTGSSVAVINLILSRLNGAKSAVCTRPSPVGIRLFDLAILPKHQWSKHNKHNPKDTKKVVRTLGVPNRISPESMAKLREDVQAEFKLSDKLRLGVLVGGDEPHYSISLETAKRLVDSLLKVSDLMNAEIALTTSRRTPTEVEKLIELTLSKQQRCALLAIAGGTIAVSNPVSVILAISDIVIVTEDSFSMVCEAASSGKKVIIVEVDRKKHLPHPARESAYVSLSEKLGITRCKIEELEGWVPKLMADKAPQKALEDAKIAADAIRKLLNE
jgi:mitochondrial fission protein ELM1